MTAAELFTSEVLNTSADLIEAKGWAQGGTFGNGGTCASNAIYDVAGGCQDLRAHKALWLYLDGNSPCDIFEWNDTPERTQAEVVEALRAAALIEAAREEQDAAWSTYADAVTA